jgi:hypothetical protein
VNAALGSEGKGMSSGSSAGGTIAIP